VELYSLSSRCDKSVRLSQAAVSAVETCSRSTGPFEHSNVAATRGAALRTVSPRPGCGCHWFGCPKRFACRK
jgi:hypothetical protein